MRKRNHLFKTIIFALLLVLTVNIALPLCVRADGGNKKVVRIGWHEPPYFITDENGRQSGYSYEYQRKVAAYTGWEYEYVEGSWSELMQMLKAGEIDILSDVSYSEERTKDMLFTSIPMGSEAYYVFVAPDNKDITSDNLASLNGKRIGVALDSIQKVYFEDWAKKHRINAQIIELAESEEESMKKLGKELDAYITMDVYGSPDSAIPICKIGSSDFYFAVSKSRPDLLTELDAALSRIQDENKYYDQELHDKYLKTDDTNRYLSKEERAWIENHGAIRIGYQDNYLAFCAKDPNTGDLTGALKDYLVYATKAFENADLKFEPICYATAAEAIEALQKGEIDCVFPANLTDYDAEQMNLLMSPPLMSSEMEALVRTSEQKEFLLKENAVVAVNKGNTNYDLFLSDHYPNWERAYFDDTPTGLKAVAKGKADCVIISNYRYSNVSKQCEKLHLAAVYTGVDMDFCFAVREGDTELYSILARVTGVVPKSAVHSFLTYYSTEDVKTTFWEYVKDHLFIILLVISAVLFLIVLLLLRSIRAEKKVGEEENLLKELNKRVFVDALTSVRNKGAYNEYLKKLQERANGGEKLDLAIGVFDCNNLKTINDQHGHDKGDIYLKNACQLVCKVFDHSPVFRTGGDEFAVFLLNDDYKNREELIQKFESRKSEINGAAANTWEEVHIAYGIAEYDSNRDKSISDTARRADKIMYENKRREKEQEDTTEAVTAEEDITSEKEDA